MTIGFNDLRRNMAILYEGDVYTVLEWQHRKAPKAPPTLTLKLRNVRTGNVYEKKMPATHKLTPAPVDTRKAQYLFFDGEAYTFMDTETYEQFAVPKDVLGDSINYLIEGDTIEVMIHEGTPIAVELPVFAVLTVDHAEPAVKGDTATGALKKVTTNTGLELMVPLFINEGDKLKVDTRDGRYIERV
ncbi:MAG: elongation factor P, partial [Chloroflexi bacterium]|nr:elongation factor P [Chloroflexota bacterium]